MIRMRKRDIWTISFCILSLILASCTPAEENISSSPDTDNKKTITFAALYGPESQYEDLIEKFEAQNPDIDVRLIPLQGDSPTLEDLVGQADTILLGNAVPAAQSQLFLDLAPFRTSAGFEENVLWPGALQGCQVRDKQIGLPVSLSPRLVFYNQDIFDKAGLATPQAGWSWEDFRAAAQALADPGAVPPRYGFLDSSPGSLVSPLIDSLLASGEDAAGLAEGLQWYVDLARASAIAFAAKMPQDGSTIIKNGQAAMWLGTLSTMAHDWQGLDFQVGAAPFPADPQSKASTTVYTTCGVISAGSAQPMASWAWLVYLSGHIPSNSASLSAASFDAADSSAYWQDVSPQVSKAACYALEHGWYGWVKWDFSATREALQTSVTTGKQLSTLLPEKLSLPVQEAAIPTAVNTPLPVTQPRATPTQKPSNETNAPSAVYFADQYYHTNLRDVTALADQFNRSHPDMRIEIETRRIGFENINSNVYDVNHFDCFAGSGAGIVPPNEKSTTYSDFTEKVYTLDPLVEVSNTSLLDDLNPLLLDAVSLDGSLYGLPVALKPYVVFYNATLLQELGLESPSLDWTVEDFWALATQVARARDDLYGYVPYNIEPFFFLSEASYLDTSKAYPEANFASQEIIGLLNQLTTLVKERALFLLDTGGTRTPFRGNYQQRDEQLQFGTAGLWIDQIGMPSVTRQARYADYDVGVAVLPFQQTLNPAYSTTLYISRRAQYPQICWEWFKYLNEQPVSVFVGLPVRQSILDSEGWAASVGRPLAEVYRVTMAKLQIKAEVDYFHPLPLSQWWADALVAVLQEGQDAAAVLQAVQFKAQATIDCMQAAGVPPDIQYEASYEISVDCASAADPEYKR